MVLLATISVAVACLDNIVRRGDPRGRWILAVVFGLVYGAGFGNGLRATGLGATLIAKLESLVSFDLGVELGHFAVLAALLPAFWGLRKRADFERYGVTATSVVVVLVTGCWLLRRTVFV